MGNVGRVTARQREAYELFREHGNYRAIARIMGNQRTTARELVRKAIANGIETLAPVSHPDTMKMHKTTVQYGRDKETGQWGVIQEWRRLLPEAEHLKEFADSLAASVIGKGWAPRRRERKTDSENLLFETAIFDPHMGMYAEKAYTLEENYNLKKSAKVVLDAVADNAEIAERLRPAKGVLVLGGDLMHSDTRGNKTEKSANPLDVDTRYNNVVGVVTDTMQQAVCEMAQHCRELEVVVTPGNHDWHSCVWLAQVLAAFYRDCKNITVNPQVSPVKYTEWGINGLFWTHGDSVKAQDWQGIISTAFPRVWGRTRYRHLKMGHVHHKKKFRPIEIDEQKGLVVEYLEALCPSDAWHVEAGFGGVLRGCSSFVYHKRKGLVDRHYHNAYL